jgi:hypothetical protein
LSSCPDLWETGSQPFADRQKSFHCNCCLSLHLPVLAGLWVVFGAATALLNADGRRPCSCCCFWPGVVLFAAVTALWEHCCEACFSHILAGKQCPQCFRAVSPCEIQSILLKHDYDYSQPFFKDNFRRTPKITKSRTLLV